jgi:hypothetical protein
MAQRLVRRMIELPKSRPAKESTMNHHETIALAEQHRSDLLADAAGTRAHRRLRAANGQPLRSWLTRRRDST